MRVDTVTRLVPRPKHSMRGRSFHFALIAIVPTKGLIGFWKRNSRRRVDCPDVGSPFPSQENFLFALHCRAAGRTQPGLAVITTAGNEMKISRATISLKVPWAREILGQRAHSWSVTHDPIKTFNSETMDRSHFSQRARQMGHPISLPLL
jgi:hypothetical protein